jgi:hypothetical protein
MRKHLLIAILIGFIAALPVSMGSASGATDISGTWKFSVDLDTGGHGEPTFVFKQEGDKLTGTYSGPLGEQKVTGTVTGAKAVFGFEVSIDGETGKATYTATIEGPKKMTGTVEFSNGIRGKWTASKKE